MTSPQFAKVIVDAPLPELDYAVGDGVLPRVGDRVLVPLGARKVVGIVTGLADKRRCLQERSNPSCASSTK